MVCLTGSDNERPEPYMAEYLYYTDCHCYVMWKQNKSSLRVINQASYIMKWMRLRCIVLTLLLRKLISSLTGKLDQSSKIMDMPEKIHHNLSVLTYFCWQQPCQKPPRFQNPEIYCCDFCDWSDQQSKSWWLELTGDTVYWLDHDTNFLFLCN